MLLHKVSIWRFSSQIYVKIPVYKKTKRQLGQPTLRHYHTKITVIPYKMTQ